MKTKSMILLTAALCGVNFFAAPVTAQQVPAVPVPPKPPVSADPFASPAAGKNGAADELVVTLLRDGKVKVNDEIMTVTEFAAKVEIGKRLSRPHVRLVGDGTAPAGLGAEVSEVLRRAGMAAPSLRRISSDMLVRYEVFSIDPAKASAMRREKPADGKFYADLIAAVEKGEAAQESLMAIRCASGQKATTESVNREIYPAEWDPQPAGSLPGAQGENPPKMVVPVLAQAFENRETGEELEVEPTKGEGSPIIELRIIPSHVWLAERTPWGKDTSLTEMPIFESQSLTTNANVTEGQPFVLGTMSPPPGSKVHANRIWFAFATVTFAEK